MLQTSLQVGKHMSLVNPSPKSAGHQLEPCLEMPEQPGQPCRVPPLGIDTNSWNLCQLAF